MALVQITECIGKEFWVFDDINPQNVELGEGFAHDSGIFRVVVERRHGDGLKIRKMTALDQITLDETEVDGYTVVYNKEVMVIDVGVIHQPTHFYGTILYSSLECVLIHWAKNVSEVNEKYRKLLMEETQRHEENISLTKSTIDQIFNKYPEYFI